MCANPEYIFGEGSFFKIYAIQNSNCLLIGGPELAIGGGGGNGGPAGSGGGSGGADGMAGGGGGAGAGGGTGAETVGFNDDDTIVAGFFVFSAIATGFLFTCNGP